MKEKILLESKRMSGTDAANAVPVVIVYVAIYELIDPRDSAVRYVGQTINKPADRLGQHVRNEYAGNMAKSRWIDELKAAGKQPLMKVVQWVEPQEADRAERNHIKKCLRDGCKLLNISKGGRGGPGRGRDGRPLATLPEWVEVFSLIRQAKTALSRAMGTGLLPAKYVDKIRMFTNSLGAVRAYMECSAEDALGEPLPHHITTTDAAQAHPPAEAQ